MMGNYEMFDFDDLYSPVSFCGGEGPGGDGNDTVTNHVERNQAANYNSYDYNNDGVQTTSEAFDGALTGTDKHGRPNATNQLGGWSRGEDQTPTQ